MKRERQNAQRSTLNIERASNLAWPFNGGAVPKNRTYATHGSNMFCSRCRKLMELCFCEVGMQRMGTGQWPQQSVIRRMENAKI